MCLWLCACEFGSSLFKPELGLNYVCMCVFLFPTCVTFVKNVIKEKAATLL